MQAPSFHPRSARLASVIAGLTALLAVTSPALAQTQPPPLVAPPTGVSPSLPVQPLPAASAAPAPAGEPPPPLPAPTPNLAAQPPADPYATIENQPAPAPTASAPFYRKWWFWTAIGAFAVTTVVIIAASSSSGPPRTDLGNMAAF